MAIVGEEYCSAEERVLTVRKTSHFSPGDGFAAYDHRTGGLAFRADTYGRGHGGGAASAGELALLGPAGEALITVRRRRRIEAASRPARSSACRSADEDATAEEGMDWEGEPLGFEVSTTPIPELPDPETTTGRPPPVPSPRRRVDDGTALLTAASNRLHGHVGVHDGILFHRRRRLRRVEPATPPAASPSGARPPPA